LTLIRRILEDGPKYGGNLLVNINEDTFTKEQPKKNIIVEEDSNVRLSSW